LIQINNILVNRDVQILNIKKSSWLGKPRHFGMISVSMLSKTTRSYWISTTHLLRLMNKLDLLVVARIHRRHHHKH
jgi:hypothetical protein